MTYSISEIADKMGLSVHTLRFYDKEVYQNRRGADGSLEARGRRLESSV